MSEIIKSTFPNIAVSDKLAFNNPPNSLEESIDLSAMFSDFEEIIASNKKSQYNNDVAIQQTSNSIYQLEEQFRPVTTRLSNLTSLDMSYKKMPEAASMNQTVIQIGKFSFERKKNK